jgi:hypothetical protein
MGDSLLFDADSDPLERLICLAPLLIGECQALVGVTDLAWLRNRVARGDWYWGDDIRVLDMLPQLRWVLG